MVLSGLCSLSLTFGTERPYSLSARTRPRFSSGISDDEKGPIFGSRPKRPRPCGRSAKQLSGKLWKKSRSFSTTWIHTTWLKLSSPSVNIVDDILGAIVSQYPDTRTLDLEWPDLEELVNNQVSKKSLNLATLLPRKRGRIFWIRWPFWNFPPPKFSSKFLRSNFDFGICPGTKSRGITVPSSRRSLADSGRLKSERPDYIR